MIISLLNGIKNLYKLNPMKKPLILKNEITIQAPAAKVWSVLTNPEETKKYMFGCEAVSDWKRGSPLLWKMNHEGKELIAVKGNIVEIDPGKFLSYTVFDPNATMKDIPENYLTVTYSLKGNSEETILTVTQGDFATVEDSERRYQESYNNGEGWNPILLEMKKLVELK
jgi:uncharacterized protein YndB with AHSA1/START domain